MNLDVQSMMDLCVGLFANARSISKKAVGKQNGAFSLVYVWVLGSIKRVPDLRKAHYVLVAL